MLIVVESQSVLRIKTKFINLFLTILKAIFFNLIQIKDAHMPTFQVRRTNSTTYTLKNIKKHISPRLATFINKYPTNEKQVLILKTPTSIGLVWLATQNPFAWGIYCISWKLVTQDIPRISVLIDILYAIAPRKRRNLHSGNSPISVIDVIMKTTCVAMYIHTNI